MFPIFSHHLAIFQTNKSRCVSMYKWNPWNSYTAWDIQDYLVHQEIQIDTFSLIHPHKYTCVYIYIYTGVSKNRGTPKWMVYNGKPYWNGWFGGFNPLFSETSIYYFNHINPICIPFHPIPSISIFWPLKGGCCWCHRWCGIGIDAFLRSRVANGTAAWLSGHLTKTRIRRIRCWKATTFTLPKTNIAPEKWMVEILLSFWDGLFWGATVCLFQERVFTMFYYDWGGGLGWKNLNPPFKKSFKVDVFVWEK